MFKLLAIVLLAVVAVQVECDHHKDSHAMKEKLIADKKDYQKLVEPYDVHVSVGITLICAQYDKEDHKLKSRVYERYMWTDPRLAWKPEDYGDVQKINIPATKVWTPDIRLLNGVVAEERDEVDVVIMSTGIIYWIVPSNYKTICAPSDDDEDTAKCSFRLGAWVYDAETVPMGLFTGGFDSKYDIKTCPYVAVNPHAVIKTTKYDCCPKPYQSLDVTFDLKKRSDVSEEEEPDQDDRSHRRQTRWEKYLAKGQSCTWPKCT